MEDSDADCAAIACAREPLFGCTGGHHTWTIPTSAPGRLYLPRDQSPPAPAGCMLIATYSITLDGKGKPGDGTVTYNVFTRN